MWPAAAEVLSEIRPVGLKRIEIKDVFSMLAANEERKKIWIKNGRYYRESKGICKKFLINLQIYLN